MLRLLSLIVIGVFQAANAVAVEASAVEVSQKTITIAADLWCPINCEPQSDEEGVGVDFARMIFEPQGYKVNYIILPWARALDDALSGKIDAVVGANRSDEPRLIFPKEGVYEISYDFYMLKGKVVKYSGFDSLKGKRIGIIKDYGYDNSVTEFINRQRKIEGAIQEVTGNDALEQNIRKLMLGRVDVVVESRPIMDYTLSKMGLTDQVKWVGGTNPSDVFVAFSPKKRESKSLAARFDEGMKSVAKDGRRDEVYKKYGLGANEHKVTKQSER